MKAKGYENVRVHLQIIHTWAEFAIEHKEALFAELPKVAEWVNDGVETIKAMQAIIEEQRRTIDRLEHELGAKG